MTKPYKKLSKDEAVLLMVDHQSGLISLVQDFSPDDFKNSVIALADIGKFFNLPTILTTSFDEGPNGPLVPELIERFPMRRSFIAQGRSMLGTMQTLSTRSKRPDGSNSSSPA